MAVPKSLSSKPKDQGTFENKQGKPAASSISHVPAMNDTGICRLCTASLKGRLIGGTEAAHTRLRGGS